MEMHITLGIILLTRIIHQSDATNQEQELHARDDYVGLPGKRLTLKWNYTGKRTYHRVSVIIPSDGSNSGNLKLWSLFYSKKNGNFKKEKHDVPSSIFNNLTEFTRQTNSIFILIIKSVPRNISSFKFLCKLEVNSWDFHMKIINVKIAVKPSVVISSNKEIGHDIAKGSDVELRCLVKHGTPPPKLEWRKDSKILESILQDKPKTALLKLNDIQPQNAGRYVCIATNDAGSVSEDVVITVKYIELKPGYSTHIKSSLGSIVDFSCPIKGYPRVMYTWFKGHNQLGQRSGLTIKIAKSEDFGNYTCEGENGFGYIKVTFTVIGELKPSVVISSNKEIGHDIAKGSDVELRCLVKHGTPPPKLEWRKDSKILESILQDKPKTALLKLNDIQPQNAGRYVCIATNDAGSVSEDVVITVKSSKLQRDYRGNANANKSNLILLLLSVIAFVWHFN